VRIKGKTHLENAKKYAYLATLSPLAPKKLEMLPSTDKIDEELRIRYLALVHRYWREHIKRK
jgi:hypothetical protein